LAKLVYFSFKTRSCSKLQSSKMWTPSWCRQQLTYKLAVGSWNWGPASLLISELLGPNLQPILAGNSLRWPLNGLIILCYDWLLYILHVQDNIRMFWTSMTTETSKILHLRDCTSNCSNNSRISELLRTLSSPCSKNEPNNPAKNFCSMCKLALMMTANVQYVLSPTNPSETTHVYFTEMISCERSKNAKNSRRSSRAAAAAAAGYAPHVLTCAYSNAFPSILHNICRCSCSGSSLSSPSWCADSYGGGAFDRSFSDHTYSVLGRRGRGGGGRGRGASHLGLALVSWFLHRILGIW